MKKILILFALATTTLSAVVTPVFLQQTSGWAEKTLARLTLDEKIGQLFMVPATVNPAMDPSSDSFDSALDARLAYTLHADYIHFLIENYHVGGVIFLLKGTSARQVALTNQFQHASKLPLLIGLDAEWGLSMRLKDVVPFPRNAVLGALKDETLIYRMAVEVGRQCREIGVHMNFAPVVDVNSNPENPVIGSRSFGDDPKDVARKGILFMHGLQDAGVLACAKHFPGHGDTCVDSHLDLPVVLHDRERLQEVEFYPFKKLIDAGVAGVMTAHLSVPALDLTGTPASLSFPIISKELKGEGKFEGLAIVDTLGHFANKELREERKFEGLVITDGLGMKAVAKYYGPGDISYQAFLAGNDILLCPVDVPKAHALIKEAVIAGVVTEQELDVRVLKILKAKEWAGIHYDRFVQEDNLLERLNTEEAYELHDLLFC